MKEIKGEMWDYYKVAWHMICITTNGSIKKNGHGVMGRGCAKEFLERSPLASVRLGLHLKAHGNVVGTIQADDMGWRVVIFPVKHNWWEEADLQLIKKSAILLKCLAMENPKMTYVLPRPGCGNGKLTWEQVRPVLQSVELTPNMWVISK